MPRPFLFLACLIIGRSLPIGAQQGDYFQQWVDYRIAVRLNDTDHTLSGKLDLTYHNRSSTALDTLWFHLWGNAFSGRKTAFAQQLLRTEGSTRFHFAAPESRGGYESVAFSSADQPLGWGYHPEHQDIAWVVLPEPVPAGDSVELQTVFRLRIPASVSRLGRVVQSYQLTQWYPKPAVFDREGWHPMPYLDLGEYYAEFGSYRVEITLPENYVVAATGALLDRDELQFYDRLEADTRAYLKAAEKPATDFEFAPFPESSTRFKTIHFRADSVHDFAWFADKRFRLLQDTVWLAPDRPVVTRAFFTKSEEALWQKGPEYLAEALQFLEKKIGPYPWPHCTAVQSALSAGAGMEYPMITVIGLSGSGQALDEVIFHEVAHNWWYGMLASNERDHPWIDEGITTYYERRYMRSRYGENARTYLPRILQGTSGTSFSELIYLLQARRGRLQPPQLSSAELTETNYLVNAYILPGQAFELLETSLDSTVFDRAMQQFFREWRLRHPGPKDLQSSLLAATGSDQRWLFKELLNETATYDYALAGLKREEGGLRVRLKNRGSTGAPVLLTGWTNDSLQYRKVLPGFQGRQEVFLPFPYLDKIRLDPERRAPEFDRRNDQMRTRGLLRKLEPLQVRVFPRITDDRRSQLFLSPMAAWNNYDKLQLGLVLYSPFFPPGPFRFALAPFYAIGSRSLSGMGEVSVRVLPRSEAIRRLTLSLQGRLFHYTRTNRYGRLEPVLRIDWERSPADLYQHNLTGEATFLWQQQPAVSDRDRWLHFSTYQLSYRGANRHVLRPFRLALSLEGQADRKHTAGNGYLKLVGEWQQRWMYSRKNFLDIRLFGSVFLYNQLWNAAEFGQGTLNAAFRGPFDYRFDQLWLGRTEEHGIWGQQIALRDGGLKLPVKASSGLGRTNRYLIALNWKADLPLPFFFPVKPYFDLAWVGAPPGSGAEGLLWSGGILLDLDNGLFSVHWPLLNATPLQEQLDGGANYWSRITFSVDFARLRPRRLWEGVW